VPALQRQRRRLVVLQVVHCQHKRAGGRRYELAKMFVVIILKKRLSIKMLSWSTLLYCECVCTISKYSNLCAKKIIVTLVFKIWKKCWKVVYVDTYIVKASDYDIYPGHWANKYSNTFLQCRTRHMFDDF
jgi:hypothetical protein